MRDESGPGVPASEPGAPRADAAPSPAPPPAPARRAPHLRVVGGADRPADDCLRRDDPPADHAAEPPSPDRLPAARPAAERHAPNRDPGERHASEHHPGERDPGKRHPFARPRADARRWSRWALGILDEEQARTAPTPLIRIPCPELPGIHLILKDESKLPSGSLKHRLARALFVDGIASGAIGPDTVIVEGSSGSTAISEAWFARRLGLRFVAVVPPSTAPAKIAAIAAEGGEVLRAAPGGDLAQRAADAAEAMGGYHMDQFARAAAVADWRGPGNIAAELLDQLEALGLGAPAWIVAGAGTGGTAATIGRHIRIEPKFEATRLCVVDPEHSAYFSSFASGDRHATGTATKIVEGIGRGRVGPAFEPHVIDHMVQVSDEGSVSGAHWLARRASRRYGPSTGTNVIGALILGHAMQRRGETGTIVLLGCDDGRRYNDTIYDARWCAANGVGGGGWQALLERLGSPEFPAAY